MFDIFLNKKTDKKQDKKQVKDLTFNEIPYKSNYDQYEAQQTPEPINPNVSMEQIPHSMPSPLREPNISEAVNIPEVPGQTEEDLKETEPLQQKVYEKTELPSALDKYEKSDNVSTFGSNLRHPESMIMKSNQSYSSLEEDVASGVASTEHKNSSVNDLQYNSEMAQNGGEFMNGIYAYDSSSEGSSFSSF